MMDTLNWVSRVAAHCGYKGRLNTRGESRLNVESRKDLKENGRAGAIQTTSTSEV